MLMGTRCWELLVRIVVLSQLPKQLKAHLSLAPRGKARALTSEGEGGGGYRTLKGWGTKWEPGYRKQKELSELRPPHALTNPPPHPAHTHTHNSGHETEGKERRAQQGVLLDCPPEGIRAGCQTA